MPNEEGTSADKIDQAFDVIQKPIKRLAQDVITTKQHQRLIAWVLVVDILLSGLLGGLGYYIKSTADTYRKASCVAGNEFRAGDLQRWNFIINLSASGPTQHQTPEQKAQAAVNLQAFKAFLAQVDAPRKC